MHFFPTRSLRAMASRAMLVAGILLGGFQQVRAFNSEEHKVLTDLGASLVVPDPSIRLPYPTRYEIFTPSSRHESYIAAKQLAVGYATNNATWHSNCASLSTADAYPAAYDPEKLAVQDNSYWDYFHAQFNQIEGNLNMWIPPVSLVPENTLYVSGYLDSNVRTFTFGDLVSIYGDYRRTTFCAGGECYLSDAPLSAIGFGLGTDCYGVWPFQTCGYQPAAQRSDVYLKRIAAGLWPPYGCLGNATSNTAENTQYGDAGWWGDEMMRIANVNEWHFSRAALAWYVGMHRLALLQVQYALNDSTSWNAALHYEANALHSLTDLFCFGHIVTNRDETSHGIMVDQSLTNYISYLWMEHVLSQGGAVRASSGRISLATNLPPIADASRARNDFLPSYLGTWANWARWEHTYHSNFNASGATVRNLRGDRFHIRGDGEVRNYTATDREPIIQAVRTSLQSLFDAYVQMKAGATIEQIGSPGSSYFAALEWIPVFIESEPANDFTGQWTRYAGAAAAISGSTILPGDWTNCQMAYINGGENLPTPNPTPCTTFPEVTAIGIEDLSVTAAGSIVSLSWSLSSEALQELLTVDVQRAEDANGPYENVSASGLVPSRTMSFDDPDVRQGGQYWYRLQLRFRDGSVSLAGPIEISAGGASSLQTALQAPIVSATGPIEFRFSLGATPGATRLDLYDIRGRLVKTLLQETLGPGQHLTTWNLRDESGIQVARGVYVARLRDGDHHMDSKKFVVVHE